MAPRGGVSLWWLDQVRGPDPRPRVLWTAGGGRGPCGRCTGGCSGRGHACGRNRRVGTGVRSPVVTATDGSAVRRPPPDGRGPVVGDRSRFRFR